MDKRILLLGASGMLGHTLFRYFFSEPNFEIFGTVRSKDKLSYFPPEHHNNIISGIDAQNGHDLEEVIGRVAPDFVINCIGIIKQLDAASDHIISISMNACLPHKLAQYCDRANARLIHFSTDCVFSGKKGLYSEADFPDANDLYGRTKLLGEVNYSNAVTLRTSIIGHELGSAVSLIDWFLSQEGSVKGYKNAVFSGLPTIEIARIIQEYVIPNASLYGLYHLSAEPIDKYNLLCQVAEVYGKKIQINPNETVRIDRSLNSNRFREATGFRPYKWGKLIERMHETHRGS